MWGHSIVAGGLGTRLLWGWGGPRRQDGSIQATPGQKGEGPGQFLEAGAGPHRPVCPELG